MSPPRRLLAALLLAAAPAQAQVPPETRAVETLHAALIESMRAGAAWTCEERARRLAPVVAGAYDFTAIARFLLRAHWPELDAGQQQDLVLALDRLALANYTGNFSRHDGESFETLGSSEAPGRARLVRTRLLRSGGAPPVALDYVLRPSADTPPQWRIVNVIAEGVSDLAIRAAQYERAWAAGGYAALRAGLEEQAGKARALCR